MLVAAPFCILCGCRADQPQDCRVIDAREVQNIVSARCRATAFHHRAVLALKPSDRYPICMQCVNWTRTAKRVKSVFKGKCFTPLDGILMHALAPGRFPEPDHRCFARLAAVAADPDNGFAAAYPERLRRILSGDVLPLWWSYNGKTTFFRHADTARAVRHTLACPDVAQKGGRRRWKR